MRIVPVSLAAVALVAAGCAGPGATKGQRTVVAAFYPLAFAAAALGGPEGPGGGWAPPGARAARRRALAPSRGPTAARRPCPLPLAPLSTGGGGCGQGS